MKTRKSLRHVMRRSGLAAGARALLPVRARAARAILVLALVLGSLGGMALGSLGHGGAGHSSRSVTTLSAAPSSDSSKPWMYHPAVL